jgi:N-acetyl-alpha-D-glucosaminyl L-malate synthase BshA
MKIIIVCYPTFGGSGVLATELGHKLAENGHEIHFIAYQKPVRLQADDNKVYFHKVNVPFYPLFNFQPYELALSSKLVDVCLKFGVELIHVHYAIPHAYAAYMAKKMLKSSGMNIPLVTTLHGTDITLVGKHPFYKTAVKFSIEQSDIVTSVSESLKQDTVDFFGVEREINVVSNFVDLDKFKNQLLRCNIDNENYRVITHVSNFRPVKNIRGVIEFFEKISKKIKCKFKLIGEGPESELAKQLIDEKNIDNVQFLGNTQEVEKELCHSDLFILPSKTESFGLAALEAMASKVIVISSNSGGLPEVNIHNETGFLTEHNNIDKMVEYAENILNDEDKLNEMKEKAFLRAQKFDINKIIYEYEDIYKSVI